MKTFIFVGGKATRFNGGKPGPLKTSIKVKDKSILENILEIYISKGFKKFYLLSGYKHNQLKILIKKIKEKRKNIFLEAIYTGLNTQTGGRLKYVKKFINNDENFFLTYGDSLANFNPKNALKKKKKKNFVMSIFKYLVPYGVLKLNKKKITNFSEKKFYKYINAGFYIFDSSILKYIRKNSDKLEVEVMRRVLLDKKKLMVSNIIDKWQPIDNQQNLDEFKKKISKNRKYFINKN